MLGGYGDTNRISTGFLDYLYCTCIAMSDGDETVLLFKQDLVRSYEPWVEKARVLITAATGIPADHIMICSTHTHSAPETNSNDAATATYLELNAFNIAGMAFVTAPYEMFGASGMHIKENSPFDITMIFGNANDWNSYCATEAAYDYMSYESSAGFFARGCAEAAANQFIDMLKGLK